MNIVKHKCHKDGNHYSNHRSGDVGLIEKQNHTKHKKRYRHKATCESIKSISNIYGIDDRDSGEESDDWVKQSKGYFACDRPEIYIIYS